MDRFDDYRDGLNDELEKDNDLEKYEKITNIQVEQGNPFYDPARGNDGGGYDQPEIKFDYGFERCYISDSSCGDFGDRFTVERGEQVYSFNQVDRGAEEYSDFSRDNPDDVRFVEAVKEDLGYTIAYKEEIRDDYEDDYYDNK